MKSFPLYAKILVWFFLNLVLLLVVFALVLGWQAKSDSNWLLAFGAEERIDAVTGLIVNEINFKPPSDWGNVLEEFEEAYGIGFFVFGDGTNLLAGQKVTFPASLLEQVRIRRGPRGPRGPRGFPGNPDGPRPDGFIRPRDGIGREFRGEGGPDAVVPREGRNFPWNGEEARSRRPQRGAYSRPKLVLRSQDPGGYWIVVRAAVNPPASFRPNPIALVMYSPSLATGGFLFDFKPWLVAGLGVVVLSAIFWVPLVRGITRSVRQVSEASDQIARGRFDVRVDETRRDELGELGASINDMAGRLEGYVSGQKRFLGDIAHELCSPISKLRLALGILEQRSAKEMESYVNSANEKAEEISNLVNELLSFSKASLGDANMELRTVSVHETLEAALRREDAGEGKVDIEIPEDLMVQADRELLIRALSNLLRNAFRYAAHAGPVKVQAAMVDGQVEIRVSDQGPGVPEDALANIFEPFYRVDQSRTRHTGGVGLGLSIVKTCIESCDGSVSCRNLDPTGLEVLLRLESAG